MRSARIRASVRPTALPAQCRDSQRRLFHDYFVTLLPSSSMHPDSRSAPGQRHNLPRDESSPHTASEEKSRKPAALLGHHKDMTVVRIPLKSAKHHFGASMARGTRPYNEDAYQAGTIELPAFAKKAPMSLSDRRKDTGAEGRGAESASGDPQVFYFGVFDGHGGDKCSHWLRERLHHYVEDVTSKFGVLSTLEHHGRTGEKASDETGSKEDPQTLQKKLVADWSETVGGYFRRLKPEFLPADSGGRGKILVGSTARSDGLTAASYADRTNDDSSSSIETSLEYSFLKADLDFITGVSSDGGRASDPSEDETEADLELGRHTQHSTEQTFIGGSTCSIALLSTPSTTPFWHPTTPFSILTAHLGDTRIILCSTRTGKPTAMTPTHHPSTPEEANRLRRFAGAFTTDSFGEERMAGLANTRAFGDRRSKRMGVSAEPSLTLLHAPPAEYSFMVLVSDGVTGVISDQEIVDIVKEAKTPEQAARAVTSYATEVGAGEQGDADNATCLVVRMGGWERRDEGGGGSLGTREQRNWRREAANDPRAGRM